MEDGALSDAETITGASYDEDCSAPFPTTGSTTRLPSFIGTTLLPDHLSPAVSPRGYVLGLTSEPQSNQERGTRIICDGCRKRRTKCDRASPCGSCTKRRKPCTYDDNEVPTEFSAALSDAQQEITRLNKVVQFLLLRVKAKEDREAKMILAKRDMEAASEERRDRERTLEKGRERRTEREQGGREESQYLTVDEGWMDARPNSAPAYLDGAIFHEQQLNMWEI